MDDHTMDDHTTDNRKPPPQQPATATRKTKHDDDESIGNSMGSVTSMSAKRKRRSVSSVPPAAKRGKKEPGMVENDKKDQEENIKEKKYNKEDVLQGTKSAAADSLDDNISTDGEDPKTGKPESSTKPATDDFLVAAEVPTEHVDIGSIAGPAGVLQHVAMLRMPQTEKRVLTNLVHKLQEDWERKDEELRRKDEELRRKDEELERKETALRQAGMVIGAPYTAGFDNWDDMPELLRNEPGAMAEYIAHRPSYFKHQRACFPEDAFRQALPQLLKRHRDAALNALTGEFLSWDEVNPTPEEYKGSETLFICAIHHGLIKEVSDIPFQESIPVYEKAVKHGVVTDISQISHLITASVPLSVEALKKGLLTHSSQAPALSSELVLDALRMQLIPWVKVPDDLKNDVEFCRALLCPQPQIYEHPILGESTGGAGRWSELARKVFDLHRSTFLSDSHVWEKIIDFSAAQSSYGSPAADLFQDVNYQPVDTNIIRYACTKCAELFSLIDQVEHQGVVRELVIGDRSKLFRLQAPFLRDFPDFFIEHLPLVGPDLDRVTDDGPRNLLHQLPENVWTDRPNLINTWIRVGLPLAAIHRAEWEVDRGMLLWIVEHGAKKLWRVCSFEGMSDDLAKNEEFIRSAMEFEPAVFQYASPRLQSKFNLALWASSDILFVEQVLLQNIGVWWSSEAVPFFGEHYTLPEVFVEGMNTLAAELRMQQTFKNVFLPAVVSESYQHSLGLLRNKDAYLKPIRDFAGIPSGDELQHRRQTLATIKSALESRGVGIPTTWNTENQTEQRGVV